MISIGNKRELTFESIISIQGEYLFQQEKPILACCDDS